MVSRAIFVFISILCLTSLSLCSVIGIDLGTEFIKTAVIQPGLPLEIVINAQSKRKTENMIGFKNGEREFGGEALGFVFL